MSNVYVPESLTPLSAANGLLPWFYSSVSDPTYEGLVATVNNIDVIVENWGIWQVVSSSYTADQYGIILSAIVTVGQDVGQPDQYLITYNFVQTSTYDSQNRITSNKLLTTLNDTPGDTSSSTETSTFQYLTDAAANVTTTIQTTVNYADNFVSTGHTSGSASATEGGPSSDVPLPNGGVNLPNIAPNPAGEASSIAIYETGSGTGTETYSIFANLSVAGTYTYDPSTTTWTAPTTNSITVNYTGGSLAFSPGDTSSVVTVPTLNDHFTVQGNQIGSALISGGGTLVVNGSFSGSASIGPNATFELGGTDTGMITFAGANATLKIDGTSMPSNVITGFAPGDIIDLTGVS